MRLSGYIPYIPLSTNNYPSTKNHQNKNSKNVYFGTELTPQASKFIKEKCTREQGDRISRYLKNLANDGLRLFIDQIKFDETNNFYSAIARITKEDCIPIIEKKLGKSNIRGDEFSCSTFAQKQDPIEALDEIIRAADSVLSADIKRQQTSELVGKVTERLTINGILLSSKLEGELQILKGYEQELEHKTSLHEFSKKNFLKEKIKNCKAEIDKLERKKEKLNSVIEDLSKISDRYLWSA